MMAGDRIISVTWPNTCQFHATVADSVIGPSSQGRETHRDWRRWVSPQPQMTG
jgi:hypothetical protein